METETFDKTEKLLELREKLLKSEAFRLSGAKTYSLKEVERRLLDKCKEKARG
ncbi:MAG: hypothetical protein LBP62_01070 [Clostridiales bacterium]|jgi:hypothetical protein|nr:hypothetical protein [Clostridiales bacterium]